MVASPRTLLLAAALTLAGVFTPALAVDSYKLDGVHSMIIFKINHFNVSNTYGRINSPAGTFAIDPADLANSSLSISVNVADIDTNNAKRDEHLKSADFFNAKQFPTIAYKSTSIKKIDDKTFEVTGDLTLHGVTKPVTVKLAKVGEADMPGAGHRAGYETTFTIKRSDFGMSTMVGPVGDEVTLMVNLEGVKE